jgi:uncharacterized membrane protein YeiH
MDTATVSDAALDVLQVVGTIAFAISGALVAGGRKMDWFGVVVLGVMVAVGGSPAVATVPGFTCSRGSRRTPWLPPR